MSGGGDQWIIIELIEDFAGRIKPLNVFSYKSFAECCNQHA